MHLVSVRLHYFLVSPNIIWFPWQRPLPNQKIGADLSSAPICTHSALIWWKDCKNRSSTYGDIWQNTLNHEVNSQRNFYLVSLFSSETTGPIFTKILHDIVALVALLNHTYIRRYPILFLNARATKVRSLSFFSQNWLPWQRPLRYQQ